MASPGPEEVDLNSSVLPDVTNVPNHSSDEITDKRAIATEEKSPSERLEEDGCVQKETLHVQFHQDKDTDSSGSGSTISGSRCCTVRLFDPIIQDTDDITSQKALSVIKGVQILLDEEILPYVRSDIAPSVAQPERDYQQAYLIKTTSLANVSFWIGGLKFLIGALEMWLGYYLADRLGYYRSGPYAWWIFNGFLVLLCGASIIDESVRYSTFRRFNRRAILFLLISVAFFSTVFSIWIGPKINQKILPMTYSEDTSWESGFEEMMCQVTSMLATIDVFLCIKIAQSCLGLHSDPNHIYIRETYPLVEQSKGLCGCPTNCCYPCCCRNKCLSII